MLISLLSVLIIGSAQLPEKATPPTPPKTAAPPTPTPALKYRFIVFPEIPQHLGSVGPTDSRDLTWELKNTSDQPIAFRVLDTAPGVKVDGAPFTKPWQPGEARKIIVSSDASGFLDYQKRAVRLESDDPSQPRYILRWDMMIRPEMAVDAPNKSFGEVAPHESPLLAYTFTREGGGPAEIRLESHLPDYLEAEIVAAGPKATLQLTLRPSKLKPGMHAGLELLKVSTNAPRQPTFDLTLAWKLRLPIFAIPSRVVWDQPELRGMKLEVKSRNGLPFCILSGRIEGPKDKDGHPQFTFSALSKDKAAVHEVKLQCFADLECRGTLFLECSGLDSPLQVPLTWLPPKGATETKKPWDDDPDKGKEPEPAKSPIKK